MQPLVSTEGPGIGIGHHAMRTGNDYGFIGTIDEVRLYRRALSATEISQDSQRRTDPAQRLCSREVTPLRTSRRR